MAYSTNGNQHAPKNVFQYKNHGLCFIPPNGGGPYWRTPPEILRFILLEPPKEYFRSQQVLYGMIQPEEFDKVVDEVSIKQDLLHSLRSVKYLDNLPAMADIEQTCMEASRKQDVEDYLLGDTVERPISDLTAAPQEAASDLLDTMETTTFTPINSRQNNTTASRKPEELGILDVGDGCSLDDSTEDVPAEELPRIVSSTQTDPAKDQPKPQKRRGRPFKKQISVRIPTSKEKARPEPQSNRGRTAQKQPPIKREKPSSSPDPLENTVSTPKEVKFSSTATAASTRSKRGKATGKVKY